VAHFQQSRLVAWETNKDLFSLVSSQIQGFFQFYSFKIEEMTNLYPSSSLSYDTTAKTSDQHMVKETNIQKYQYAHMLAKSGYE
jgi:hypothetical protein